MYYLKLINNTQCNVQYVGNVCLIKNRSKLSSVLLLSLLRIFMRQTLFDVWKPINRKFYAGHMRYSRLCALKSHGWAVIHNFQMIFVSTDHSTALNSPSVRVFVSVQEKEIDESNIQQEPFIKFLQIPVYLTSLSSKYLQDSCYISI